MGYDGATVCVCIADQREIRTSEKFSVSRGFVVLLRPSTEKSKTRIGVSVIGIEKHRLSGFHPIGKLVVAGVLNGFTEEDWQKVFARMGAAADKPERALAERAKLVRQQRVGRPRESKRGKQSLPELPCVHKDCANWKSSGCWHATICEDHRLPKGAGPTDD